MSRPGHKVPWHTRHLDVVWEKAYRTPPILREKAWKKRGKNMVYAWSAADFPLSLPSDRPAPQELPGLDSDSFATSLCPHKGNWCIQSQLKCNQTLNETCFIMFYTSPFQCLLSLLRSLSSKRVSGDATQMNLLARTSPCHFGQLLVDIWSLFWQKSYWPCFGKIMWFKTLWQSNWAIFTNPQNKRIIPKFSHRY